MTAKKQKTVSQFLKDHLWSIIMGLLTAAGAFIWLKADVISLKYRVDACEEVQASYPSQDWFELKFDTIDNKFVELEKKIDDYILN